MRKSRSVKESYERIIALQERLRISEILDAGFELNRNQAARTLAFKSDVSAEIARGILLTTPTDADLLRERAARDGAQRLKVIPA